MSLSNVSTPMTSPMYPIYSYHQHSEQEHSHPQKREKRKYRCRKRSPATIERAKTVRRDKANARERKRMNSLNDALEELRTVLPHLPDEPKMTKIETLKNAQDYIHMLAEILADATPTFNNPPHLEDKFYTSSSSYQDSAPCSNTNSPHYQPIYPPQQTSNYYCSYYPQIQ